MLHCILVEGTGEIYRWTLMTLIQKQEEQMLRQLIFKCKIEKKEKSASSSYCTVIYMRGYNYTYLISVCDLFA